MTCLLVYHLPFGASLVSWCVTGLLVLHPMSLCASLVSLCQAFVHGRLMPRLPGQRDLISRDSEDQRRDAEASRHLKECDGDPHAINLCFDEGSSAHFGCLSIDYRLCFVASFFLKRESRLYRQSVIWFRFASLLYITSCNCEMRVTAKPAASICCSSAQSCCISWLIG